MDSFLGPIVMSELASVGEFCPNDQCSNAGKTDADNIIRYGKTGNGRQRYRCKTCGKTFSETTGTIFSGKRTPKDEIIETLALVAEGTRVASLSRVKGYKESTIRNWLQQAAEHAEEVENALMSEYEIDQGQLDGLWSYVGKNDKKEESSQEESAQKKTRRPNPTTRTRLERFGEQP
jgi:transposase-like protein